MEQKPYDHWYLGILYCMYCFMHFIKPSSFKPSCHHNMKYCRSTIP